VRAEGVDPAQVYVTGMSNGAMMSYALACATDILAAIAAVAGTLLTDCPSPTPVSVLHIHGLADDSVRFDGGLGSGVAEIDGPPIPSVIERWRTVAACTPPSVTTVGPVQNSIAFCAEGREVALTTVDGAGHQWPGAESARRAADPSSTALDATETIWRFFAANPHP
jgi:polyhydroxybutyrate depolymerase